MHQIHVLAKHVFVQRGRSFSSILRIADLQFQGSVMPLSKYLHSLYNNFSIFHICMY